MGRTVTAYSRQIDHTRERFSEFRRGLRRDDQDVFDRLWHYAKFHVQSGVMAASPYPFDTMLMGMLIEMQKDIDQLKRDAAARLAD